MTPPSAPGLRAVGELPVADRCPLCNRLPDIDECGPSFKGEPHLGWYANCYGLHPYEHNVGVNADTRLAAIRDWNKEVAAIRARSALGGSDAVD